MVIMFSVPLATCGGFAALAAVSLTLFDFALQTGLEGERLEVARAWVDYAISPENQRDLLLLAGYDPTNAETVRLLDKATARARLKAIRRRELDGLDRWREVPRRERYLAVWQAAKADAGVK